MATMVDVKVADSTTNAALLPRPYRVRSVRREMRGTVTLALEPIEGALPQFSPGQFNMLYAFGVGEVPISVSASSLKDGIVTHTVRAVGAVSEALSRMKPGDAVGLRGPYGTSWPVRDAEGNDILLIAGGIGLAPLRPAVRYVADHPEEYGNVALLYGARTPRDILYRRELDRMGRRTGIDVRVTVDQALAGWTGDVGVVGNLIPRVRFDPLNTVAMLCGPEIMLRFVVRELQRQGIPNDDIYVSMERNMKCGIGICGHCQFGPYFICKDGPVFRYDRVAEFLTKAEV